MSLNNRINSLASIAIGKWSNSYLYEDFDSGHFLYKRIYKYLVWHKVNYSIVYEAILMSRNYSDFRSVMYDLTGLEGDD